MQCSLMEEINMRKDKRTDSETNDITGALSDVHGGFAIDLDGIGRAAVWGAANGAGRAFLTGGNALDGAWKGAIYGGFAGLGAQAMAAPASVAAPAAAPASSFGTPPTGTGTFSLGAEVQLPK
jgi:hypothetical protein